MQGDLGNGLIMGITRVTIWVIGVITCKDAGVDRLRSNQYCGCGQLMDACTCSQGLHSAGAF